MTKYSSKTKQILWIVMYTSCSSPQVNELYVVMLNLSFFLSYFYAFTLCPWGAGGGGGGCPYCSHTAARNTASPVNITAVKKKLSLSHQY